MCALALKRSHLTQNAAFANKSCLAFSATELIRSHACCSPKLFTGQRELAVGTGAWQGARAVV